MPSNKRQKELARRRAERQAARRAEERARRRKRRLATLLTAGGAVVAVVLVIVAAAALKGDDKKKKPEAQDKGAVACDAKAPPAPQKQTFKKADQVVKKGTKYTAALKTSCGTVSFEMFADKAPETANSLAFLASKKFYDGTFCHRMTNLPSLTVLQCGDPEGTGGGGPGYTLPEENLKGAKYPRGTVAMAKTQAPHSTGSQFFLVAKDSDLPPEYTVIGKMDDASLAALDKAMAVGIEGSATDGAPTKKIYLESFTVTPAA